MEVTPPMVSNGPSLIGEIFGRRSPMGLGFLCRCDTDGLQRALHNWHVSLPITLNGPGIPHKGYSRSPHTGPAWLVEHLADDLQWTQYNWQVLKIAFNAPRLQFMLRHSVHDFRPDTGAYLDSRYDCRHDCHPTVQEFTLGMLAHATRDTGHTNM